ncbi:MAG: flagellar hook capping FlgD N-terminal domain-containing protein [Siculibacillus sp.]
MSILGLSTPQLSTSTSTSTKDKSTLSGNYEMFMNLLVTQMQNQDPLNPMDTSTFTNQLVQYSQVEQQIKMNANLGDLKALLTTQNASNLVSYVGKTVEADGTTTAFDGSKSTSWDFTSSAAATNAKVTIKNDKGETVYTTTKNLTKGNNTIAWDGTTSSGAKATAGNYSIAVEGSDSSGNDLTITTALSGVVTGIDFSGSTPMLEIGGSQISAYKVIAVSGGI